MEQAAAEDEVLRRSFDVKDAATRGHPLGVAAADHTAATVGVLVLHDAVDHVGHGFEAAVRVPRCAFGFSGCVVDLAHLVHVDEGIEGGEVDAGEGAVNGKAFTFVSDRCGGDALDGAVDC